VSGIALFVLIAVVALAVAGLSAYWNHKRGQALAAFAAAQGWSSIDEAPGFESRWDGDPFGNGDHRRTNNALRGPYEGFDMIAFEYSYQTHTQTKNGRSTQTHSFSVVALLTQTRLPGLSVSPEGGISRMFGKLFNTDIQLESEEFNRAFTVTSDDRKLASAILHPRTMEGLLAYRDVDWDIRGGDFVSVDGGNLDPAEITRRCDAMLVALRGVPDFVWEDLGGRPASLPPEVQA
jgi:hypothetical protein